MGAALVVVTVLLALALALLLAVPVAVAFRFERIAAFRGQIMIRSLFGLVRFRIRFPKAGMRTRPNAAADTGIQRQEPARRSCRRDNGGVTNIIAALRQSGFRRRVCRLACDLIEAAHPRQLRLRLRLGLGDPADTGRLWALIGPLIVTTQNLRHTALRVEPEFIDPVCEFHARGRLRVIPLQVLVLAAGFALSPASIRAWRALQDSHA